MSVIVRLFANAVALWLTVYVAQKVGVGLRLIGDANGFVAAVFVSIVFAVVNAVVRPVLLFLSKPLTCLTLGLFTFVINALLFWAVGSLNLGFEVDGFLAGLFGSVVFSVISSVITFVVADKNGKKRE
jgi:putative membrane protein